MKIIQALSLVCLGVILTAFLPDKEKETLRTEVQRIRTEATFLKNTLEKEAPSYEAGITVFPQDAKSITLKGFTGTLTWYNSPNFEQLFEGGPADFFPIEQSLEIQGGNQTILIPPQAKALSRKNKSGTPYEMKVGLGSAF